MLTLIIWGKKKGYIGQGSPISSKPRLKCVPKEVVWLEWEDLMKVYSYEPSGRSIASKQKVLNAFLLSCFTGLRYSDILSLRWTDIYEDAIHIVVQKTNKPIVIELNNYSAGILQRCKAHQVNIPSDHVFPDLPQASVCNRNLKILFSTMGFEENVSQVYYVGQDREESVVPKWKALTMHCGRRTFICNALQMGISPQVIMQWTGHSNYDCMKPYIAVADKTKAAAMSKFNQNK